MSNVGAQENSHMAKFESLFFLSGRTINLGRLFIFSRTYNRLSKTTVDNTATAGNYVAIVTMPAYLLTRHRTTDSAYSRRGSNHFVVGKSKAPSVLLSADKTVSNSAFGKVNGLRDAGSCYVRH